MDDKFPCQKTCTLKHNCHTSISVGYNRKVVVNKNVSKTCTIINKIYILKFVTHVARCA